MPLIFHLNRRRLYIGVTSKVRTKQGAVEGPGVLGICGRMHADKSSTSANETLERGLLSLIQHIARCGEEDNHSVCRKRLVCKDRGVLAGLDSEAPLAALLLYRDDSCWN